MKNKIIISLILLLILSLLPTGQLQADQLDLLRIVSLRVSPSDDLAIIYWSTNYPTTGHIQFGPTNGFGNWVEDNRSETYHETTLAGLTPDQTYYFRLEARTFDGNSVSSDTYSFETLAEDDSKAPIVSDVHTSFVTGNTATFVWETNEASNSCVYYDTNPDDLKKKRCHSSRVKVHDLSVTGLTRNALYYYRISSTDRAGNDQYSVTYNFKTNFDNDENIPELQIYELTPFNRKSTIGPNELVLTIKTNRPIEGYISYGEKSGSYKSKAYLPAPRSTYSEIALNDLKENQVYYYKLHLEDVLGKKLDSPEFSFTTLPSTLLDYLPSSEIFNINNPNQDFDADGLTNAEEQEWQTDPIVADTDGDGYVDGTEVSHGYNPLGPGKLNEPAPVIKEGFAYGQPRLASLKAEQNLALDLKNRLETIFGKQIPKSTLHWYTLVNAYIYGGYPIESIAKAIGYGGKTVHPDIPWTAWRRSADYLNYIDR